VDPEGNPVHALNRDYSYGEWWGGEFQVKKKFWEKHNVIAGFEFRDNVRQEQGNYDVSPYFLYLNDHRRSTIWAPYLQGEFALRDNLRLTAGVRYDHYSTFGGTTNPRAALIYNPFPKTYFKFLYGRAFRAPNAYELFYTDGGVSQEANPNLRPEKIQTFELIWEQYLGRHLRLVGSGFYYRIRDLISQVTDPATGLIVFQNLDRVDAKGLEWQLEGRWGRGWETRLSYTYQEAKNLETGHLLSNSPRHLAKFNLIAPLWQEKIFGGIELQYMSNRLTLLNNVVNNVFITNLTLFSQRLWKKMEFSASVYNVFDRKFQDPGGAEHLINGMDAIRQDGRNFRVKLTIPF
jgi:iron complex outermembrane receptor protein